MRRLIRRDDMEIGEYSNRVDAYEILEDGRVRAYAVYHGGTGTAREFAERIVNADKRIAELEQENERLRYELQFVSKRDNDMLIKATLERAAEIVEAKERKQFNTVGDPRIKKFTPYMANAIRAEIEK